MQNKNIVITGANSGIGLEILKRLANGNRILAVDKDDSALRDLSLPNVQIYVADVSKKENIDAVFDCALSTMGGIDIFFANAGFGYFERLDNPNYQRIEKIFATNVFSPIYSYQKALEVAAGRKMQFVLTASGIGKIPVPGYALYGATKAALNAFEEALREELPKNIALTVVYPVAVNTNFYAAAVDGKNVAAVELPTPKQSLDSTVDAILRGVEKRKKRIYPFALFPLLCTLSSLFPPLKRLYWHLQYKKLLKYESSLGK